MVLLVYVIHSKLTLRWLKVNDRTNEHPTLISVTPLGQLPFFINSLKVSGLFDAWVDDCPLVPSKQQRLGYEVLATLLFDFWHLHAHITAIHDAGIHPELLELRNSAPKMRPR